MFEDHNDSIYEILKSAPNIDSALLMELSETFIQTGKSLADSVIDGDLLKREELLEMSAAYLDCEYDNDLPEYVPTELAEILNPSVALMYGVVPEKVTESSVTFYAVDPFNGHIINDLTFRLNKDVHLKVADPEKVEKLLNSTYEDENASVGELLGEIGSGFDVKDEDISDNELSDMANQTPRGSHAFPPRAPLAGQGPARPGPWAGPGGRPIVPATRAPCPLPSRHRGGERG